MAPDFVDDVASAEVVGNVVRWHRYYGTRQVKCAVTGDAINDLRGPDGSHADGGPLEIFMQQTNTIAAAVTRKYDARGVNDQNEIVIDRSDL